MSFLEVSPSPFKKTLSVPTSKSYGNRLLILAALRKEPFTIKDIPLSTDVETMIHCLKSIGVIVKVKENEITVENSFPACEKDSHEDELSIETGDGGTTNRFLLALLSLGSKKYKMILEGDMRTRPMGEMINVLDQCGCQVLNNEGDISIQGPLKKSEGDIQVDSSKTTQFITGLKLIEEYGPGVTFNPEGMDSSVLYYQMTLDLIEKTKNKNSFTIPVDFSSLGYPIAAGLTLGDVHITNCLERDLFQADSVMLEIMEEMGASFSLDQDGLKVKAASKLGPIQRDCSGFPDLVPTLAYLASYADGESSLKNLEVLTYKESDRFEEVKKLLSLFEIPHHTKGFDLYIQGQGMDFKCGPKEYLPKPDHRMIMVGYLYMRKNNGGKLHQTEHVAKSYGNFFQQMS